MKFVTLRSEGARYVVNPAHIVAVVQYDGDTAAIVHTTSDDRLVQKIYTTHNVEEIVEMIAKVTSIA